MGKEIAEAVSRTCPAPVKLQFEKVYLPWELPTIVRQLLDSCAIDSSGVSVLITKKRYVGFKFESPSQLEPDFDAKVMDSPL